jgi:lactate dehydrogenase-like 2-hydroxyacid dehydrogenase
METDTTRLDPKRDVIKILVVDNIDLDGKGAAFEFLKEKGYTVHRGPMPSDITEPGVYVSYQPDITPAEIAKITTEDAYDGIITAAKNVSGPVTVGARMGAGVGNMQIDGIVTNTPGQNSAVTAERTIQAMLHARRDIGKEHEDVVRGTADSSDLSAYTAAGLGGQTLAVIGAGNIGQEVIKKALGMGMTVQVYNRSAPDWAAHFEGDPRVSFYASPKEAATGADVISVHTALTPETKGLVNTEVLSVMNPDALIVNYARGEVCDPDSVRKYLAANPGARLCVDADLFADTSRASPLEPFVEIAKAFPGQTVLTPHTAADTCPTTRVNCFKQGIAQTEAALFEGKVMNFAGNMVGKEFPAGYKDSGTK